MIWFEGMGQPQLGLPLVGVRVAEVREHVAAAPRDLLRRFLVTRLALP